MNLAKVLLIIVVGIYLIGNFQPYYDVWDSYNYANSGIQISKGNYGFTNSLLNQTGFWEFVPPGYTLSIHNTAIPITMLGMPLLTAIAYLIGGYSGIFYLNPIITIIFLIVSERIATRIFDQRVGLLTLLFLSLDSFVIRNGQDLMTDNLFALLVISGTFFLIKFTKEKRNSSILFASILFSFATFFRITGIFYFPILILFISFYLINYFVTKRGIRLNFFKYFSLHKPQINLKIFILFILIPWILFFIFWFSFNTYYFGDPFTNYDNNVNPYKLSLQSEKNIFNLFIFDEKSFENFKSFSKFILPYPISGMVSIPEKLDPILGNNWLGFLAPLVMLIGILLSFKTSKHISTIMIFSLVFLSTLWFYSSNYYSDLVDVTPSRYMIVLMPIFFMILSWLIIHILDSINPKKSNPKFSLIIKSIIILALISFFSISFYFSEPVQAIKNETFYLKNPSDFKSINYLEKDGFSIDSVIVNVHPGNSLEFGAIPFNPYLKSCCTPTGTFSDESIEILIDLVNSEKNVLVFKNPKWEIDQRYREYLVENYDIRIRDVSPNFCKLVLDHNNSTNDLACMTFEPTQYYLKNCRGC